MGKMAIVLTICVLACALEQCMSMGTYYWTYPDAQNAYVYPAPYQPYATYPQILPVDCDQNKVEGGNTESSGSESSSESGESGELKKEGEEGSTEEAGEGTEESNTEEGESKEEGGESKEEGGESKEEGGESKEEGEPKAEGESTEAGEKKEEGENKEGEEKKKEKKPTPLFPPVQYTFPPRAVQQYIVSVPANYPYRTYSIIQQQPIQQQQPYPVKSSGSYPYYSYSSIPVSSGYSSPVVRSMPAAPVVRSMPAAPVSRYVSGTVAKYMSPVTYSISPSNGYQAASYWSPSSNMGYYKY